MAKYTNNLDVPENNLTKDLWLNEGAVFSGDMKYINERQGGYSISPLLGAAILGLNNTASPATSTVNNNHYWTDIDAQEDYLNSKPTCYLILGKPGLGAYSLGESISRKYNCVHLCPKSILMDEIMQGSSTGKCLEFNMKHNKVCSHKTILKILRRKLESSAVQHRGYVISGIPMVTSHKESTYLLKTNHSEDAVVFMEEVLNDLIFNLKRKKPKPAKHANSSISSLSDRNAEEEIEDAEEIQEEEQLEEAEEEELVAELPKYILDTCYNICFDIETYFETKQTIFLQQLEGLFNLNLKPDVIICFTCPDADVVTKKCHKYVNYKSFQSSVEPFPSQVFSELRWPTLYNIKEHENPRNIHIFNSKYNCRLPLNFTKKSEEQLCNYRECVLPFIENTLMDYDPKQVIKLDGRTSNYQMMYQVTERLLLMDVKPVIIPEPLYIEEPSDDFEEFWKIVEEAHVIRSGVLKFGRHASPWVNRCPVELKKRKSVIGKPKLAVMFLKHVYLLSSIGNFVSFCRNPRPFLKLQYLEPTCRIIITGTKSSGKTMTAECLSWIFDTPVSTFTKFVEDNKELKYQMFSKTILSEISATIEDTRYKEWQQKECDRIDSLNEWSNLMLKVLKEYIPLMKINYIYLKQAEEIRMKVSGDGLEIELENYEQNLETETPELPVQDPEFIAKLNLYRDKLSFLPVLDNMEDCEAVIKNNTLLQYAPLELITTLEQPALPVLGDDDVTKAIKEYIVTNDLQKELDPTTEEIMEDIIKFLSTLDETQQETNQCYGKYIIDGFPSDPDYWEHLSNAKLIPDYTISIMENREIEPELMLHYLSIEKRIKNHQEIISYIKDPLIISKSQTKQFPDTKILNMKIIANDLVNNSLQSLIDPGINYENINENALNPEFITTFAASIETFRENWDIIKIKLEEQSKCFIEIEIENKTDIEVLEEVLLKLRQCYYLKCEPNEDDEAVLEEEDDSSKNLLSYNFPLSLCETNIYCPFTYFNYGELWEGKQEFSIKYDSKIHYFGKEEFMELFQNDITKYQAYNNPFKKLPKLRVCITGCLGSGTTTLSKHLATELGLMHIDFKEYINHYYMPRHFKKVGRRYENPFKDMPMEEEAVVEFQMDEENPNLLADILSNETELRRMIYNYYERGQPMIPILMHKIIQRLWFDNPFVTTGFLIDGYPRLPQDIEDLIVCNCIPDLIIDLDSNVETVVERLGPMMFNQWKSQFKEAKEIYRMKIQNNHNEWMIFITKKVVIRLILEEILDSVITQEPLPSSKVFSYDSFIYDANPLGSLQVDPNLFTAYNELIAEYPEQADTHEWEKPEDVREAINSRLEAIHETEYDNIQSLKEVVTDNKIKLFTIDGTKPLYKVCRIALAKLSSLRNRSQSFFEQTIIITNDIAEILLSQGYCFLSKFGRLCPVYIYENQEMIFNSYKISRRKGKLFPVIHRAYIYFISSEDRVNKFRMDPLNYITSNALKSYYTYPLRIGIIGPPKSGKSSLSVNLSRRNNLMCISRGMALRHVLEQLHWTELASNILKNIENGEIIDTDLIMNAVETVAIDHRVSTYGFVLDGFPSSSYEALTLSRNGLYPNIIFDISSEKSIILDNSHNEIYFNILKYKPPYSLSFIENRFSEWNEQSYKIRQWVKYDYDNVYVLNGNESKWQCLQVAKEKIRELISKIHYYLANVETSVVPASVMGISNEIFEQKQSGFRNICPACVRKNIFRHSGYRGDKTGVIQYKNKFYWICTEHLSRVLKYPGYYLLNEISIPEIPAIVKLIDTKNVYENGICIVTYAENLPAQSLQRGTNKFAATYKHKTYLFCSETCLYRFLDKPHLYSDITVFKESNWFPCLSLKKLPHLGYLEQTLANILTQACCAVNVVRPKYPGLSFQVSALIYIGLYMNSHNGVLPKEKLLLYQKALKQFEQRSKLILQLGLRMRSMENPFSAYPKSRRVPVPDERFDYLCEFHKPASKVPAFLNVVDIAGLVRGAAEGQGLGNAFLSHIKACDAIFNLCRAFDDEDVIHVDGDVNPVRDLETIGEELRLKDEEQLMQNIEKLDRVVNRGNDKKLKPEHDTLMKIKTVLIDEKKHIRFGDWSAADIEVLNKYLFLTSKPALYLVNLSEKDYIRKKNKWLPKLKEWIDKNDPGAPLIPFSGVLEMKLIEMDPAERQAFLKENNLTSALDKIIIQGYKALHLEYFFTAGPDEVKAWTIQKGTKAPQAAGRIHTDFEKGFIMAEVMHYKDFKEEGTEAACKAAGKYRQQGRNYVVEDGDIIFFKFNAGAGLKDAKKK